MKTLIKLLIITLILGFTLTSSAQVLSDYNYDKNYDKVTIMPLPTIKEDFNNSFINPEYTFTNIRLRLDVGIYSVISPDYGITNYSVNLNTVKELNNDVIEFFIYDAYDVYKVLSTPFSDHILNEDGDIITFFK